MKVVKKLSYGGFDLHRITHETHPAVRSLFEAVPDSEDLIEELEASYLPEYDQQNKLVNYGFYILKEGHLAGLSLLGIDSWPDARGNTGADILPNMRGQGIAPACKVHLFYLGFEILGLNRIDTGHLVSNIASQRSIQKTPGFIYEGTLREYERNAQGQFEDTLYYGILRRSWLELYRDKVVEVEYE